MFIQSYISCMFLKVQTQQLVIAHVYTFAKNVLNVIGAAMRVLGGCLESPKSKL